MISVEGVLYNPRDSNTDFSLMIKNHKYNDCLFLFNDNFLHRNFRNPGGGSAKIRPYAFEAPCRAIGISTGWSIQSGGFQSLDDTVTQAIWCCFEHINLVLTQNPNIKRVLFPCDHTNSKRIGFSIFSPSRLVADYINQKIREIPLRLSRNLAISRHAIVLAEDILEQKLRGKRNIGWTQLELQTVKSKKVRISV